MELQILKFHTVIYSLIYKRLSNSILIQKKKKKKRKEKE